MKLPIPRLALLPLAGLLATPASAASYLCFGDSITYGQNGSSSTGYLGPLADYLTANQGGAAVMINVGVGGETPDLGENRLRPLLNSRPTDYVLIMEGTNDVPLWQSGDPTYSPSASQANLRDMVRAVKNAAKIPILATVPPRLGDHFDPDNSETRTLNNRIRSVASSEGIALAEVYENIASRLHGVLYEDTLHPNALGHRLVAEAFAAAILSRSRSEIDLTPPLPLTVQPKAGSRSNSLDVSLRIGVAEDKHPIDSALAVLKINGQTVTPVVDTTSVSGQTLFLYDFPGLLGFNRSVSVDFTVADTATPPNQLHLGYSFTTVTGNGTNGDIDRSGRIDGLDLAILAASFGTRTREPRYRREADIDLSGEVDGFDLMLLTSSFGGPP